MPRDLLLDTNAAIAMIDDDRDLWRLLDLAGSISLPTTAFGELVHGAHASARVDENLDRLSLLADLAGLIGTDVGTAILYGELKAATRRIGRTIPDNDLWIAAVAVQHGLTLVTRDTHFDAVEGIELATW